MEREKQREIEERDQQKQELRERELQREVVREQQRERLKSEGSDARQNNSVGLVIGNQLNNLDPVSEIIYQKRY